MIYMVWPRDGDRDAMLARYEWVLKARETGGLHVATPERMRNIRLTLLASDVEWIPRASPTVLEKMTNHDVVVIEGMGALARYRGLQIEILLKIFQCGIRIAILDVGMEFSPAERDSLSLLAVWRFSEALLGSENREWHEGRNRMLARAEVGRHLNLEDKAKVVALWKDGKSFQKIGEEVGVTRQAAHYIARRHKEEEGKRNEKRPQRKTPRAKYLADASKATRPTKETKAPKKRCGAGAFSPSDAPEERGHGREKVSDVPC